VKRIITALAVALAIGAWAQGKDAKPVQGDPKVAPGINWLGQVVRATGAGAPDMKASSPAQARLGAERAAQLDAFRNLLAQVKGISIDGTKKMGELMEKDEIRSRVEGVVRGYKVVGKRYFSDQGVEIDIEVPTALLTDVIDPDPTPVAPPGADSAAAVAKAEAKKEPASTGLVIDARGLKVMPALAPRVLDESGKSVYSVDTLSKEARKASGVASYVQTLEEAQKSMKAGERPLVIKAAKANGSELVLGTDEAKRLAAIDTSFLTQGKVVIVLN
jgi:hypothetical protein